MSFRDLLVDTIRTLWAHKVRTALTMFGIAWGIVSITLMVGSGEGFRVGQLKVQEQFGRNILIVNAGRTSLQAGGMRSGRRIRFHADDYKFVKAEASACEHVMPELGNSHVVKSRYNSATRLVVGSLPAFAHIRTIDIASGRFYNDQDVERADRVAIVGSDVYKQLFAGREAVGGKIQIKGVPYKVIGVMQEKDQDSNYDGQDVGKVFLPFTSVVRDFPNKTGPADAVDRLIVTPKDLERHEECKAQVRRALGRLHDFDPTDEEAAGIWDTIENSKRFKMMTDGLKYFLGAVGIVTLFLGGIGVMNVMLVAVRERTREIGIRKAVGATRGSIVRQFFVETMIVVLLSGAIGMTLAHGICAAVNSMPMPPYFAGLIPTWESTLLSFSLLGLVAILSAIYPASRAASVDPIEALHYEAGG
jgi:putative ABC transport system permease protein